MCLHVRSKIARQCKLFQTDIASVWFITCNEKNAKDENNMNQKNKISFNQSTCPNIH